MSLNPINIQILRYVAYHSAHVNQQYNFSQDINVGSFMNVSKSYEHDQMSSMIGETLNNFGLADGSSLNTNYAVQSSADCHFKSFITRHHLKKPFI
ncbi:hypothetical protein CEXT_791671 [Caerostris extrusa]|uniref:Uncharacterized protein n=1 Tax=Caerostris extrusa TaxID=172846 RepID=A0AAV4QFM7_CAEEX|nr:hypothetical protein CEXT_791671 [Caerostris extrusa]